MPTEARAADWLRPLLGALTVLGTAVVLTLAVIAIRSSRGEQGSPGPGWVRAATLTEVAREDVVYVSSARVFVVADTPGPIALSALSPHLGERVLYCLSSGYFEDPAHGDKFDRFGDYALGPAPRGLDHVAIQVQGGVVWVNPQMASDGPPRGQPNAEPPVGPFCRYGEGPKPGFAIPGHRAASAT
jgi:Rieske Fe-S protein